nr:hypothetical protein CFP56_01288 [Quercus suber]
MARQDPLACDWSHPERRHTLAAVSPTTSFARPSDHDSTIWLRRRQTETVALDDLLASFDDNNDGPLC